MSRFAIKDLKAKQEIENTFLVKHLALAEAKDGKKYLNIVFDETERLTKLTNDILDLSKMQSGTINLEKADFDIHELLISVLDTFEDRINKKGVQVNLKLIDGRTLVHGDRSKMERVVFNLIDNALKFVNEDGYLEVMTNKKEDKILVGIRNTGSMIPEEKLATIWNRFSKLDDSRGERKDSSGLGLAIVKEILDSHEEKIEVYSNNFLGVMFVFSLSSAAFKKD